ncbi:hypothetical protein DSO57_1031625 [Entomophthora muscae]|uniref:Uncharacterized protein n=1 Tax=Entomophthora muscae TaxID=34485 RepID=A0ACC2UAK7_9FUNG|nr:hypothetical protein DSO57_1031625 [Entomophthora muscae]
MVSALLDATPGPKVEEKIEPTCKPVHLQIRSRFLRLLPSLIWGQEDTLAVILQLAGFQSNVIQL